MNGLSQRRIVLLLYICGCVLWAGCPPAFGQTRWQNEEFFRFFPEETVAMILLPDLEALARHLTNNHILPRLSPTFRDFSWPALIQKIGGRRLSPLAGSYLADIVENFHQASVLALLNNHDAFGSPASASSPCDWALLAEIDAHEQLLSLLLEKFLPALQAMHSELELGVFEFHGETLYRFADLDFQVYFTMLHHTFLAAMNREALQRLVLEFQQGEYSATAQHFASAAGKTSGDDLVLAFNLPLLRPSLRAWMLNACSAANAPDIESLTAILETYRWPVVSWQATIGEDTIIENLRIWYPPQTPQTTDDGVARDSLLPAPSRNLPFVSDRVVSNQAMYYGARHMNFPVLWQEILRLKEAAPEARQIGMIERWRTRLEAILQTPSEKWFAELGTLEIGTTWYPPELVQRRSRQTDSLAHIPLLLMLHADAHGEIARSLQRLSDAFELAPSHSSFQGIDIIAYKVPFFGETQRVFHAVVDDILLFSWSDTLIKESVRAARYGQSLADDQAYRSAVFPPSSLTRGYLNLSQTARQFRAYWQRQPANCCDFDPELTDILETLSPMTWATTVEPEGFLTVSRSPIGGPAVGLLMMWLIGFSVL